MLLKKKSQNIKKIDFNDFTENYDLLLSKETQFFSSDDLYFAKYKIDILKDECSLFQLDNILEFGAGTGRNLPYLSNAFNCSQICASDISEISIEIAKKNNPNVHCFVDDFGNQSFGNFDLIFIAGVFHHIIPKDRAAVFARLHSMLKPNGYLFIFEHNPYNPVTLRIVDKCPYDRDAVLIKPYQMRRYISETNFKVLKQRYCLFFPPFVTKKFPILDKFFSRLFLGGQYWTLAKRV